MKKIKLYTACASLMLLGLASCDVENLNNNPNKPTLDQGGAVVSEAVLGGTIRAGIIIEGDVEERSRSLQTDFYSQVVIDCGKWETKNYDTNDGWNNSTWTAYQKNVFSLTSGIKGLEGDPDSNPNLLAFAKTWRVYVHSLGCDKFGPMPFITTTDMLEAGVNPKYRSVEDIYTEYFAELDAAAKLYTQGGEVFGNPSTDVVFGNNAEKWQKFNNSLRLRFALRLSEIAPEVCKTQAAAALAAPGGVMTSAADDARCAVVGDGGWGNKYNYYMFQVAWGTPSNMSLSFERLVTGIGGIDFPTGLKNYTKGTALSTVHPEKVDPRAPIMFMPAAGNGNWAGIPYGPKPVDQNKGDYSGTNYAEMGGYLYPNGKENYNRPYDLMLYEEVCFLKAEAYLRGFIAGGDGMAKAAYEDGIRASFDTWGAEGVDEYLASTDKNYAGTSAKWDDFSNDNGNTKLEKIITQKYIAGGIDLSQESWNDKRRLNLPRLDVAIYRIESLYNNSDKDIKKSENFIQRMQYPTREDQINGEFYEGGVQALGGKDNVTTPIWWASKKSNYCTSDK